MSATTTLRDRYEADGFVFHDDPRLPADMVRGVREAMDALRDGRYATGRAPMSSHWTPGDDPRTKLVKIENPHLADDRIFELISHPVLGEAAAAVTGAGMVQVWWVQLLQKASGSADTPITVGWHQDRQYWSCWAPGSQLLTVWIAVSDVGPNFGPLRFLRASHRWGFLDQGDFYGDESEQRTTLRPPAGQPWDEVAALLPPGAFSIHDQLTYHSSGPNHSGTTRCSFAVHLRTEHSRPAADTTDRKVQYLNDARCNPVVYGQFRGLGS